MHQSQANGESQDTTGKQQRINRLKPFRFKKGDPRINRSGRPKSLDQLRARAQEIANQGDSDRILKDWATSSEVRKQELFMWYAFGKPPEKLEATGLENKTTLILHYDHERQAREDRQRVSSSLS